MTRARLRRSRFPCSTTTGWCDCGSRTTATTSTSWTAERSAGAPPPGVAVAPRFRSPTSTETGSAAARVHLMARSSRRPPPGAARGRSIPQPSTPVGRGPDDGETKTTAATNSTLPSATLTVVPLPAVHSHGAPDSVAIAPDATPPSDLATLQGRVAALEGLTQELARALAAAERRAAEARSVLEVSRAIPASLDLRIVLDLIVTRACHLLGATKSAL